MNQIWSNLPTWTKFLLTAIFSALLAIVISNPNVFDSMTSDLDKKVIEKPDEKIDKYSVLDLLVEKLINREKSNTDDSNDIYKYEGTISGKIYRSLQKPIDLYKEVKFIGKTVQESDLREFEANLVYRDSIVKE